MRGVFQFPTLSRLSSDSLPTLSNAGRPLLSDLPGLLVHLRFPRPPIPCAGRAILRTNREKTAIRAQEGRFCARTADKSSSVRRKGVFAHGLLKKDSDPVEGRLLSGGQWEYGINVILGQSEQAPDLVIGRSELIAESTGKIELLCS